VTIFTLLYLLLQSPTHGSNYWQTAQYISMILTNTELTRIRGCITFKVDISYVVTKWLSTQLKTQRPARECTFTMEQYGNVLTSWSDTSPQTLPAFHLYLDALNVRMCASQIHIHKPIRTHSNMTRKCLDKAQHYVLTACSATNLPGSAMCDMMRSSAAALRPTCSELGQLLSHAPRE
jgi:hypothetical protein